MAELLRLVKPNFVPPLDDGFRPAVLANRAYQKEVEASRAGVPLLIGLERADGSLSRFEITIFPDDHPRAGANLRYAERLIKFLLWQRGGWKVYAGGSQSIATYIQQTYAPAGPRAFDFHFMGETVYQKPFTVVSCAPSEVPAEQESEQALGRHLEGYRIG
ncbi:MAG TPA: ROK family protein, partial [Anaerolineae bacterium]|nr:ROK family protein [Anaerolineae bacterium]